MPCAVQDRVRWTLAVTFPLVYFWVISGQTLVFGRYLMPLIPFVCVLAASAVVSGVSLLRRFDIPRAPRTALIGGLTVAALLPPAIQAVGFNMMITRTSTVEQAHHWILENVPAGSKIAIETRVLLLEPEAYKTTNVPRLVMDSRGPGAYEEYVSQGYQYVVASSQALWPLDQRAPPEPGALQGLHAALRTEPRAGTVQPERSHPGPEIRIFALKKD